MTEIKYYEDSVHIGGTFGRIVVSGADMVDYFGKYGDEADMPQAEAVALRVDFLSKYRIIGERYPADPEEDYYQGMNFATVIQRKADSRRFGFAYWEDISKHGEAFIEANGTDHGYSWDADEVYVFTPVEPFTMQGFKVL